ncbi:MAG TPA: DNA-3-methyladenine glycosylase [Candidatus Saccharimonadales bacterium]|nr:DNA-3-methyladenine glycosylase [Candidatus Saccharimonadales bacterium]
MAFKEELKQAAAHLAANDPVLAPIIERAGPPSLKPHQNYYWELIDSIISQQLSVKAAASIEKRFKELFKTDYPEPEAILEKSIEDLRAVGLSRPKAGYIQDLALHILKGKLKFDKLDQQSNAEIIGELTDIKGIGEWTAHMFLIFSVGRLDVLPTGDLGIRNGIRQLYGFKDVPTPEQIQELAKQNKWHPYESVASWYVWHSLATLLPSRAP